MPTRHGMLYAMMLIAMLFGSTNYGSNPGFMLTFLLAGLGMAAHIAEYVGLRAAATGTYFLPHRLESPYAATTGHDTVAIGIEASLIGKIR